MPDNVVDSHGLIYFVGVESIVFEKGGGKRKDHHTFCGRTGKLSSIWGEFYLLYSHCELCVSLHNLRIVWLLSSRHVLISLVPNSPSIFFEVGVDVEFVVGDFSFNVLGVELQKNAIK